MLIYILPAVGLVLYLIAIYFLTGLTKLAGSDLWILRAGLAVIGIVIAVLVVFLLRRRRAQKESGPAPADSVLAGEVQFLVREANQRLAASTGLRGGGKKVSELPAILVLGDPGSTKTSVVVNSGLVPELLAGQDRLENNTVPPTRSANLWLGAGTVIAEAGSSLLSDPGSFGAFVRQLKPGNIGNLMGRSGQSPRAVVVCIDCEVLSKPEGSGYATSAGKRLNQILGQAAQTWGNRLPVYALFTRLDRISYFMDYVRNLGQDEASQVFGMTLPLATALNPGVYNQEQTQRLSSAFDSLFVALAAKRIDYLGRENDPAKPPNIYEFPREYRKLRDNVVRLLLDLGRPSQLRASPFLRGFFFTGVRPVTLDDSRPAQQLVSDASPEATQIFRADAARQARAPMPAAGGRRVPQWVFLGRFFADALLGDRAAAEAGGAAAGAGIARRIVFGSIAALLALYIVAESVSFIRNRNLMTQAKEANESLRPMKPIPGQPAAYETLQTLDKLRVPAAMVSAYDREGAPWSYRWGLYPGRPMYENVRSLYCEQLKREMLSETQDALLRKLRSVPNSPGPKDDYDIPYSALKAHLITSRNPEKSETEFMLRVLTDYWTAGRNPTPEQVTLAREQFRFYADERPTNFCPARPDDDAILHARLYLKQFQLVDRAYRNMIDEVSRQGPPLRFTDPTGAMADPQEVAYAYSKPGYTLMQAAIRKAPEYINREPWVLGEDQAKAVIDPVELTKQLQQRYQNDFILQWTQFLEKGRVNTYSNFRDASTKLGSISAATGPMLRLFCMISTNTTIDNAEIARSFSSIEKLTPSASCTSAPIVPANRDYMGSMASLKVGVDRIVDSPNPSQETLKESESAKTSAIMTAQSNNLLPKAGQLLQDPIIYAEALMKGVGKDEVNAGGASFCSDVKGVLSRFPFNSHSNADVRPDELAAVFAPGTGRLWQLYAKPAQEFLALSGETYVAKKEARFPVNDRFVYFFNRAANVSRAFFPANAKEPKLSYGLSALPSPDLESFALQIDKTTLKGSKGGGEKADFTWPDGGVVNLEYKPEGGSALKTPAFSGPWAVTRFFAEANRPYPPAMEFDLTQSTTFGRSRTGAGSERKATLRLGYDTKGGPITLQPADLQLICEPRIVR